MPLTTPDKKNPTFLFNNLKKLNTFVGEIELYESFYKILIR